MCNVLETASILVLSESYWIVFDISSQMVYNGYVTGSGKSLHLRTKSEFNFIAQDSSYTKDLSIHSVSTVQC